jgi:hypothetical protein
LLKSSTAACRAWPDRPIRWPPTGSER